MLTRNSRLLLGLTVATPLLFAACTDNNIFGLGDAAGQYTLTVYANVQIPPAFQFQSNPGDDSELPNGGTVIVNSGTLALNTDGTFVETDNFTKIPPGGQSFSSSYVSAGTFTVSGTSINLFAPQQNGFAARNINGTVNAGTVSYVEGGVTYEYQR